MYSRMMYSSCYLRTISIGDLFALAPPVDSKSLLHLVSCRSNADLNDQPSQFFRVLQGIDPFMCHIDKLRKSFLNDIDDYFALPLKFALLKTLLSSLFQSLLQPACSHFLIGT